jgi:hypothetical protein
MQEARGRCKNCLPAAQTGCPWPGSSSGFDGSALRVAVDSAGVDPLEEAQEFHGEGQHERRVLLRCHLDHRLQQPQL